MRFGEQLGLEFETDRDYANRMLPLLVAIARELGGASIDRRVTVAEIRYEAEQRGILTGLERGKRLSFIHEVFPKAGFEATAEFRRSFLPRAHRNLNRVWYLPEPSTPMHELVMPAG